MSEPLRRVRNLATCFKCIRTETGKSCRERVCQCPAGAGSIADLAQSGLCPKGLLTSRLPPAAGVPEDFEPATEVRRMKAGGCCGKPAKE